MALRISGRFCKIWKVEDGEYGRKVTIGTSRKDKQDVYHNSNWWNCRFVGGAKDFGEGLNEGDLIKIISGQLENVYNKEKKVAYFNLVVFEAEYENNNNPEPKVQPKQSEIVEEDDDSFPF